MSVHTFQDQWFAREHCPRLETYLPRRKISTPFQGPDLPAQGVVGDQKALLLDLQHLPRPGGSWYLVFGVMNESNGFLTETSFVRQRNNCSMFSCEKSNEVDRDYRGAHEKCLGQEIDSTCRAARGWKLDLGGGEIYFADCPVVYACIHTAASCPAVKYQRSATYATVPWPLMYLTSVESLTSFARMTNSGNCGSAKSSQESSPVDQVRPTRDP